VLLELIIVKKVECFLLNENEELKIYLCKLVFQRNIFLGLDISTLQQKKDQIDYFIKFLFLCDDFY
jgi:hypothetical protein